MADTRYPQLNWELMEETIAFAWWASASPTVEWNQNVWFVSGDGTEEYTDKEDCGAVACLAGYALYANGSVTSSKVGHGMVLNVPVNLLDGEADGNKEVRVPVEEVNGGTWQVMGRRALGLTGAEACTLFQGFTDWSVFLELGDIEEDEERELVREGIVAFANKIAESRGLPGFDPTRYKLIEKVVAGKNKHWVEKVPA